ncbi:hypothetical protein [Pseudomonas cremoricolorata]|uniref:Uncharacterized protein n=1 Tax=Pseudomonas cremoricolorata TaxID=157783 RepID=A0A089WT65_9PSED|nr:hypothetical protein [Pseudomonas cremoricolorata]AIR89692.1 hypothetical protein LK03_10495 [Pseudomonas cremoricolorata]
MHEVIGEDELAWLQASAEGPSETFDIIELSLGKAVACAVVALLALAAGGFLALTASRIAEHLSGGLLSVLWGLALALLAAGLAGLSLAEALRRRHGARVLTVSRDTLRFADDIELPWETFDSFEVDQRLVTTSLLFAIAAYAQMPPLPNVGLASLAAPHVQPVPGGLRIKIWMCTPKVNGRTLDYQALANLLFPYLEGAQARRTLSRLYPDVENIGGIR